MILKRIRQRLSPQSFPNTAEELAKSDLFAGWWYYSVELLPGLITKGQYPDSFPMLPRILLRNCDLRGTHCLDLGSMEGLMPVVMCRQGAKAVLATDAIIAELQRRNFADVYVAVDYSPDAVEYMKRNLTGLIQSNFLWSENPRPRSWSKTC